MCVQTTEGSRLTSQKWTSQLSSLEGQRDTLQSPHAIGAQWCVSYHIVCMSTTIKYFNQNGGKKRHGSLKEPQNGCDKIKYSFVNPDPPKDRQVGIAGVYCFYILLLTHLSPWMTPWVRFFSFLVGDLFPSWGLLQLEFPEITNIIGVIFSLSC